MPSHINDKARKEQSAQLAFDQNLAHFSTGAPDAATLDAYTGALLVLPLAGEVAARDGSARAGAGECLVADNLASLDFSRAEVTLLTRSA